MKLLEKLEVLIQAALDEHGQDCDLLFTTAELVAIKDEYGCSIPSIVWKAKVDKCERYLPDPGPRTKQFLSLNKAKEMALNPPANKPVAKTKIENKITPIASLPNFQENEVKQNVVTLTKLIDNEQIDINHYIPQKNLNYVSWGHFAKVKKLIATKAFFPILITGEKGNGKTVMVEQACAALKRPFVRVNITAESDESRLIGSMNLIDGNTVWTDGLVIKAMKMGAVLLLDEVDLGSDKIMCLQSILEGKPYINKKTSEVIYPQEGFTIIGTANTKGHGNITGQYVGARSMNNAFLDRIKMTFEQSDPTPAIEKKILVKAIGENFNEDHDDNFVTSLTTWAKSVREGYGQGTLKQNISTRRLISISEAYMIFDRDVDFAINQSIAGYEDEDIDTMVSLWRASFGVTPEETPEESKEVPAPTDEEWNDLVVPAGDNNSLKKH